MPLLLSRIEVALRSSVGSAIEGVLVSGSLYLAERYYYGFLVGVTDADGFVSTTGGAVAESFSKDRELFPMDYRVPIGECDGVSLGVVGGGDFVAQLGNLNHPFIDADVRTQYQAAANAAYSTTWTAVEAPVDTIVAELTVVAVAS